MGWPPKTWSNIPLVLGDMNEEIRDNFNDVAAALQKPIWLRAQDFVLGTGAAHAIIGSGGGNLRMDAWAFDAAAIEYIISSLVLPDDWDGGNLTAEIYWAPTSTNTGNVIWQVLNAAIAAGEQIDQAADETDSVTQAGNGTVEALHITSSVTLSPASKVIRIAIQRDASNGSDTYTADASFIGILLHYTSQIV